MVKTYIGIVGKGNHKAENRHRKQKTGEHITDKNRSLAAVDKQRQKAVYPRHRKARRHCKDKILQQKAVVYAVKVHRSSFASPLSLFPRLAWYCI